MLIPFFTLAAVSPARQRGFRSLVTAHLLVLGAGACLALSWRPHGATILGHVLLVSGIVQGALLLGWRLTQLPKSQSLEFLLVSPVRPAGLFLAEALVGLARLALITLAGLPVLLLLILDGVYAWPDLVPLLAMPLTFGAVAGLSLITWAYEPAAVRRWGERVALALIVLYLLVGVLAGEHLRAWLAWLPDWLSRPAWSCFEAVHRYSPFAVMQKALAGGPGDNFGAVLAVEAVALGVIVILVARAACRLKGHFDERHYAPAANLSGQKRPPVGDKPLRWWAVRRVSEYAGRVNLWLAGGFGLVYAAYTVAGDAWPAWLGRSVFQMFDGFGGVPGLATGLVVLAAVPAAYQYGLWDSSAQERCRRLELLLLTRIGAAEYWEAAAAAAWRRGRGYLAVAGLMWASAVVAEKLPLEQALAGMAAGVILWGLYFALGFRAFASGAQANALGMLLTLGLPLLAWALAAAGRPALGALLPPGAVYHAGSASVVWLWLPGAALAGAAALLLARRGLSRCERELRAWYDLHHGSRMVD